MYLKGYKGTQRHSFSFYDILHINNEQKENQGSTKAQPAYSEGNIHFPLLSPMCLCVAPVFLIPA